MRLRAIQRILGLLLMVFSITLLPPVLVSFWYQDGAHSAFITAFLLIIGLGIVIWLPARQTRREMRMRDGFIVVVMFWFVLSSISSLPFMLADNPHLSLIDAMFEAISGLTTTGATVITGLEQLPRSILYYRQQLQWLGGMGIVVLAVAVLPLLGIGGMQLYRAEAPGPVKDSKLTPRIAETAKALWYIYLGLTVACAIAYWLAGMEIFDAIGHSFSTVSIGGFSTHDASIGYYNSTAIEMIAVLFMLIAGVNFALHFGAIKGHSVKGYLYDSEFRFYIGLLFSVTIIVTVFLYVSDTEDDLWVAFTDALFQSVSIGTTTGFTTAEYYNWPGFVAILLLFTSFVGGCAGSTGGGIKVIRFLLLIKQGMREILRLIHPNAQIPIRVGGRTVPWRVVEAIWGFFALYVASFVIMYLALAMTGLDLMTAYSAVAATINNLGPGLAGVGAHYADINDAAKLILCFSMLLGRLEVFTLIVILSPAFWAK